MFEKIIIQCLLFNSEYARKFITFIKKNYFQDRFCSILFNNINKFYSEYNKAPSLTELYTIIQNLNNIDEDSFKNCVEYIKQIKTEETYNPEWLDKETKKWIRNSAFRLVILDSATKLDEGKPIDDMVDNVKKVFNINFDETIGNNFKKDYEKQFEFYNRVEEKFESNLTQLNLVCGSGVERKTLNCLLAPTNTGKTSALISLSASYLKRGYNVLYITCEMSEEKIRQRFDANFLNVKINDVTKLTKDFYFSKMEELGKSLKSNLIVKEFPTSACNVNHIRNLLTNLNLKENFVPDIVIVDYLNLLNSTRIKNANSYETVKNIAEEIRGIAVENNLCFWTATQTNRSGDGASDIDITDTSESYGLPMTLDLMVALIQTEELKQQNRQVWKCLKTRYSELKFHKFVVSHDFSTCKVTDIVDNNNTVRPSSNAMEEEVKAKLSDIDEDYFS